MYPLKRLAVWALLFFVVGVFTIPNELFARAPQEPNRNLVIGVWNLNLAKSKFLPGPAPISQKRTYEAHPEGIKATIRTVYADGHSTYSETVAEYDGVEYPIVGNPDADRIKLKKIDAYTAETQTLHAGTVVAAARRVISMDEKTMTITYTGILNGEQVKNIAVYDREK
jgi:hypothetical protein